MNDMTAGIVVLPALLQRAQHTVQETHRFSLERSNIE